MLVCWIDVGRPRRKSARPSPVIWPVNEKLPAADPYDVVEMDEWMKLKPVPIWCAPRTLLTSSATWYVLVGM